MTEYTDLIETKIINSGQNMISIRGVMPGSKIGVWEPVGEELLLYAEADGCGNYEGEVYVKHRIEVVVKVRWPPAPRVEKWLTFDPRKKLVVYAPDEDWVNVLYQ